VTTAAAHSATLFNTTTSSPSTMAPVRTGFGAWYAKVAAFNVEDLFVRKKEPGPPRTVFVNENLPDDYLDDKGKVKAQHVYPTNQVITSKYTVITFLPRNLLEQFRRVANVYVLYTLNRFHLFNLSEIYQLLFGDRRSAILLQVLDNLTRPGNPTFAHCLGNHRHQGWLRGYQAASV